MTLYDEVVRVPLIVYSRNLAKWQEGMHVTQQVRTFDIAPTILDLAKLAIPDQMEGVSLQQFMTGWLRFTRPDLAAFSQVGLNDVAANKDLVAYTTPKLKYIYDFRNGTEELYNLKKDPKEQRNLTGEQPEEAAKLRQKVREFKATQLKKLLLILKNMLKHNFLRSGAKNGILLIPFYITDKFQERYGIDTSKNPIFEHFVVAVK